MADPFFEVDIVGVEYLELGLQKYVSRLPQMMVSMQRVAEGPVMDRVMTHMDALAPVLSGATKAELDWREVDSNPEETKIEVISTAENVRTGTVYPKFRAYGFNRVNGVFWEPPELEEYGEPWPEYAGHQAMKEMRIGTGLFAEVMQVVNLTPMGATA